MTIGTRFSTGRYSPSYDDTGYTKLCPNCGKRYNSYLDLAGTSRDVDIEPCSDKCSGIRLRIADGKLSEAARKREAARKYRRRNKGALS